MLGPRRRRLTPRFPRLSFLATFGIFSSIVCGIVCSCASLAGLSGGTDEQPASDASHGDGDAPASGDAGDASSTADGALRDSGTRLDSTANADSAAAADANGDAAAVQLCDGGIVCGGECVDPTSSLGNCGACGNTCTQCTSSYCLNYMDLGNTTGELIPAVAFLGSTVYWAGAGAATLDDMVVENSLTPPYPELINVYLTNAPFALATDSASLFIGGTGYVDSYVPGMTSATTLDAGTVGTANSIAVDLERLYWTDSTSNKLLMMPKAGGTVVTVASGLTSPTGLAVDAKNIFWISDFAVFTTPIPTGGQSSVQPATKLSDTTVNNAGPTSLIVYEGVVYWADYTNGQILSVPESGGSPTTFVSNQANPTSLVTDGTSLYWSSNDTAGGVFKKPFTGGAAVEMATLPLIDAVTLGFNSVFVAADIEGTGTLFMVSPK